MRSDVPKVLHRVAGGRWSSGSSTPLGRRVPTRVVAVVRPGDGVAEGLPDGVEVAEQTRGRGHRRRGARRARAALERSGTVGACSPATSRSSPPSSSRGCSRSTTGRAPWPPCSPPTARPGRLRPHRARRRRPRRAHLRDEAHRRPARRRSSPSARSTSAPTSSTPARCSRRSTRSASSSDERYLTGVFPVIRESGGTVAAHMTDDADAAIGVNDRVGLMDGRGGRPARLIEAARPRGCHVPAAGHDAEWRQG